MNSARHAWLERCGFGPAVMRQTKVCPRCGALARAGQSFCPGCGAALLPQTLYDSYCQKHRRCPGCGTVLASDARFCPGCGRPLAEAEKEAEQP